MANILEVDVGRGAETIFAAIRKAAVSRRAETRMVRGMREALRQELLQAIADAYDLGEAPMRTGRSRRLLTRGVRVFGTLFRNLRGHIVAPPYLIAHEEGSTIRPKTAQALAIPMDAALRADGTPKLPGPNSWRRFGTFVWTSPRTGRGFIVRRDPANRDNLIFLYVLVEEVQLKKYKGFMVTAWNRRIDNLVSAWGDVLLEEIARADLGAIIDAGARRGRSAVTGRFIRR